MPKVYYAHPISIYNTPQEQRDVERLQKLGFEVVNPNSPECDAGYRNGGMEYFRKIVADCDAIAVRGFLDGSIPAGVAKEVVMAAEAGKPMFELPSTIDFTRRTLNVDMTRAALLECGCR